MQTIGSRLDAHRGIGPGFDFLRTGLACGIVAWHVNAVVWGDLSQDARPYVWLVGYFLLASFFSLSGFLIAGQQMVVALLPSLKSWPLQFLLVLPLIMVFAAFSWHFVERPILQLRRRFSFVARVRLAETGSDGGSAS